MLVLRPSRIAAFIMVPAMLFLVGYAIANVGEYRLEKRTSASYHALPSSSYERLRLIHWPRRIDTEQLDENLDQSEDAHRRQNQ